MKPPPLPPRCNRKDITGFQLLDNPPSVPARPKKSSPAKSIECIGGATALPDEPLYENGSALTANNSPTANLIILNTPSPTPKIIVNDLLTVPNHVEKRSLSKTPISDPVSPNVPWHPELDRRHSDSANMMFAQQQGDHKHTYQNTSLQLGTTPKVSSHDQLLGESSNKSRQ